MKGKRYFLRSNGNYGWVLIRCLLIGFILCGNGVLTSSCAQNVPQQNKGGQEGKRYASGDGAVTEYSLSQRGESANFSGAFIGGASFNLERERGHIVILNFWYATCPPCRKEAPALEEIHQQFKLSNVKLVGVNVRDEAATAMAFVEKFGISYPNIIDKDGGVLQSLSRFVPARSIPTTLILDRQGRVAARILGAADRTTLKSLVAAVVGEA